MKEEARNTLDYLQKLTETIHGWTTPEELLFLYRAARCLKGRGGIVEIGSWKGRSTVCLAQGSKQGSGVKVYAIDPFSGSSEHQGPGVKVWTLEDFKNNLDRAGVQEIVLPLVSTSEDAAKNWDKPVEFLFIDGAHEYEAVKSDFLLWFPHLIEGGVVAFHDTTPDLKAVLRGWPIFGLPGPRKVVNEHIFGSRKIKNIGLVGSIIFATKCSGNSFADIIKGRLCQLKMVFKYFVYGPYPLLKKIPQPIKTFFKKFLIR